MRCAILGKMTHLSWKIFFGTNHYHSFHLPIGPFHCTKFEKLLQRIQSYEDAQFLDPKWRICQNKNFSENLLWALFLSFMPISTCQKSKSDINLLVKYWRLKITEISLAKRDFWLTWEPDFSQEYSFCRMSINHKNFHFTQILDKTNDVIFLKIPETMFLGHFWPFLVTFTLWGFFPTNLYMSP